MVFDHILLRKQLNKHELLIRPAWQNWDQRGRGPGGLVLLHLPLWRGCLIPTSSALWPYISLLWVSAVHWRLKDSLASTRWTAAVFPSRTTKNNSKPPWGKIVLVGNHCSKIIILFAVMNLLKSWSLKSNKVPWFSWTVGTEYSWNTSRFTKWPCFRIDAMNFSLCYTWCVHPSSLEKQEQEDGR